MAEEQADYDSFPSPVVTRAPQWKFAEQTPSGSQTQLMPQKQAPAQAQPQVQAQAQIRLPAQAQPPRPAPAYFPQPQAAPSGG